MKLYIEIIRIKLAKLIMKFAIWISKKIYN